MTDRIFPPAKPEGFVPAVPRYSATIDDSVLDVMVLLVGVQALDPLAPAFDHFASDIATLFSGANGPSHHDHARYVDERGYTNRMVMAYWPNPADFEAWWASTDVVAWWTDQSKSSGSVGYFAEPIPTRVDALETIAFREYISGLAACPMSTIAPMDNSGYWGAARDRIPRSVSDRFDAPDDQPLADHSTETLGRRVSVVAPANHCVIRSGVSWHDCGPEQLASYEDNVLPKLNAGMEYLRTSPIEAGCWSLRQVEVVTASGTAVAESWVTGHFVSLAHLERWAHKHPTHLAIYGQAQKERVKYQDALELRTYHEVYVVEQPRAFEYLNCHPDTGALGLLPHV